MTTKQIEYLEHKFPVFRGGVRAVYSPEVETLIKEISCRKMIESILIYGGTNVEYDPYMKSHIEELGIERVRILIMEQKADFDNAVIHKNVHTDSEGVSYNSIVYADE